MKLRTSPPRTAFVLFVCVVAAPNPALAQGKLSPVRTDLRPSELALLLSRPVPARTFAQPMTLKEFFALFTEYYRVHYRVHVPIVVDENSFKEENPDAPDLSEMQVKLPPAPTYWNGAQLLRFAVSRILTNNGAYLVRPGYVVVTTYEHTTMRAQLSEEVLVRFRNRPLHKALDDLYEQTGVQVVLDPRVRNQAAAPVNLHLARQTMLGTALVLLAETNRLKLVDLDGVIVLTSPALAQQLLIERSRHRFPERSWSLFGRSPRDAMAAE